MKAVSVVGARPQFVKAAVVHRALSQHSELEAVLIHTGQHYDAGMSKVFFEELDIPQPDYDLEIGSGSHGNQTGRMLIAIEDVLSQARPNVVVVYGDTNSTLAGALSAAKLLIPVVHVEAGLRSFNREMPEEINRVLTDHLSELLFAPTDVAVMNLLREGIDEEQIHKVGDVMYDAALLYGERAEARSEILQQIHATPGAYSLVTIHRAENTDCSEHLQVICETLGRLSDRMPVIFPVHPRTRKALDRTGLTSSLGGVHLTDPLGYLDMVMLEKNARLILTDSGGVQKEAFFYRVPCVTLREETEWIELVELGWNRLAPPASSDAQWKTIEEALSRASAQEAHPYGLGDAGSKIATFIVNQYCKKSMSLSVVSN
jgi:UDP-GlcNAc3NAcA epimerase